MAPWRFLIDENLHPLIVDELAEEQLDAAYVPEVLFEGADDDDDVLPFARTNDYIVVTNDLRHFSYRDDAEHEGIILVYDGTLQPFEIAAGILDIVDAYSDRVALRGYEVIAGWLLRDAPAITARGDTAQHRSGSSDLRC